MIGHKNIKMIRCGIGKNYRLLIINALYTKTQNIVRNYDFEGFDKSKICDISLPVFNKLVMKFDTIN